MTRTRLRRSLLATTLSGGLALAAPVAMAAEDGHGGPGPSTPDLKVLVVQPTSAGPKITLTARTDAAARPYASLVLRDGTLQVTGFEVHRVALMPGEATAEEDQHAIVRGAGQLADGSDVQVWFDVRDSAVRGDDQVRIRIRPLAGHEGGEEGGEEGGSGHDGGSGAWTYDWTTVLQVHVSGPSSP